MKINYHHFFNFCSGFVHPGLAVHIGPSVRSFARPSPARYGVWCKINPVLNGGEFRPFSLMPNMGTLYLHMHTHPAQYNTGSALFFLLILALLPVPPVRHHHHHLRRRRYTIINDAALPLGWLKEEGHYCPESCLKQLSFWERVFSTLALVFGGDLTWRRIKRVPSKWDDDDDGDRFREFLATMCIASARRVGGRGLLKQS